MARTNSVDSAVPAAVNASTANVRANFSVLKNSDERVYDVVAHYGADSTGATDDTTKIQAAIDDVESAGGGIVRLPSGVFKVTQQLTITGDNVYLIGSGDNTTQIKYVPDTPADSCLLIKPPVNIIANTYVGFMEFLSDGTATGVAIEAEDMRRCTFEHLGIEQFDDTGGSGGAFLIKGRDQTVWRRIRITNCTVGFYISPNTLYTSIDADAFHFQDIYCNCNDTSNGYGWKVTGTDLSNITIDGYNHVPKCYRGFSLEGAADSVNTNIVIRNLRVEQGDGNSNYGIYIDNDTGGTDELNNLIIDNFRKSGSNQNGIYLRDVVGVSIRNSTIVGNVTALNMDNTCDMIYLEDFQIAGGATLSHTGLYGYAIQGTSDELIQVFSTTQPLLRKINTDASVLGDFETLTVTVDLTAGQLQTLKATPRELVAAQGAGTLIEFVSAVLVLDWGTAQYVQDNADEDFAILYDDGNGEQIATQDSTGFITSNADAIMIINASGLGDGSAITSAANVNKNIAIANIGTTEWQTGDSPVRVLVTFRVHNSLGL